MQAHSSACVECWLMKFTFAPESRPLDGFTLKRAIYRGGFGEVYYGISDAGREVALKLLQHNSDVELRGVEQCLNLSHPNLVTIFDVRKDAEGDHWIVMEYISGETLEAAIQRHPKGMPVELVLKWLSGIALGVGFLHGHRIVHRDLKPGNIFLDHETVKVGDVGLSKMMSPSKQSAHTQSVGTVYYMAPEVARGKYGPAVDIYATGIIIYEMLTGFLPFDGESTGEILMKHLTELPDLNKVPAPFRSVVQRALEKDPLLRYESMSQLLRDFEDAAAGRLTLRNPQRGSPPPILPSSDKRISRRPKSLWGQFCFDFGHIVGASGKKQTMQVMIGLAIASVMIAYQSGPLVPLLGAVLVVAGSFIAYALWHTLFPTNALTVPSSPEPAGPPTAEGRGVRTSLSEASKKHHKWTVRHQLCTTAALLPVFTVPLTVLLAWIRPSLFELPHHDVIDPGMIGFFALSILIAGWGIVTFLPGQSKLSPRPSGRWSAAIVGGLVGAIVGNLSFYLMTDLTGHAHHLSDAIVHNIGEHPLALANRTPTLIGFMGFFALWYWLRNWSKLISPQRESRFSMMQVFWTAGAAWMATRVVVFPVELALSWGCVLACSLQLASPWDSSPRPKFIQH